MSRDKSICAWKRIRGADVLFQIRIALDRPHTTQELLLRPLLRHVNVGLGAIAPEPDLVVGLFGNVHAEVEEELRDDVEVRVLVSHVAQSQQADLLALVNLLALLPVVDGEPAPAGHLHGIGRIERVALVGSGAGNGGGDGLGLQGHVSGEDGF